MNISAGVGCLAVFFFFYYYSWTYIDFNTLWSSVAFYFLLMFKIDIFAQHFSRTLAIVTFCYKQHSCLHIFFFLFVKKYKHWPWLVWLSGWVLAFEPKGRWFDSQSEHMPGVQARSPVWGVREETTHWHFSTSLTPSLPLCLKINKIRSLKNI